MSACALVDTDDVEFGEAHEVVLAAHADAEHEDVAVAGERDGGDARRGVRLDAAQVLERHGEAVHRDGDAEMVRVALLAHRREGDVEGRHELERDEHDVVHHHPVGLETAQQHGLGQPGARGLRERAREAHCARRGGRIYSSTPSRHFMLLSNIKAYKGFE